MEYLEKIITEKPRLRNIDNIGNRKKSLIIELNDKIYRFDKSFKGWVPWIIGTLLILTCLFLIFGESEPDNFWPKIIFSIIFGLPGLFLIIYGFVAPKKEMVFDRMKGTLLLTRPFRKSVIISFKTGYGVRGFSHDETRGIDSHLAFVSSKTKPRVGGKITDFNVDNNWAFTVWYMDKNRPLPPGTAFDPYRQRDFERRKAEGFPKPLYPSNIPTPEATPEQQAERKRIGGW